MTKDELEKATGQELIDARDYCGVDGYYAEYLKDVNAEMLKRFECLAELKEKIDKVDLNNVILLKIINCIKFHLCKQDEDYDKPIISPKFLSDILDQMAVDGFEMD